MRNVGHLDRALLAATVIALGGYALAQDMPMGELEDVLLDTQEEFIEDVYTEEDAFGFTTQYPAMQDDEGQPELADDVSVEMSVAELQELLNLPAGAMAREWQEDPANPRSLFRTQEDIDRIFQQEPSFIYFPDGVDPMIIPWVRERVVAEELFQEAMVARGNRDFERAKNILRTIQEEYPNTQHGQQAPAEVAAIDRQMEQERQAQLAQMRDQQQAAMPTEPGVPTPELPQWVRVNTTGVIIGETPMVIVGSDFLRPGDPVPRYSSVRVKSVAPSEVVYVYQDREFPVEVVGTF